MKRAAWIVMMMLLAGCTRSARPGRSSGSPRPATADAALAPRAAGVVTVRAERRSGGGAAAAAVVVDNQTDKTISLRREITVEKQTAAGYQRVDASMLYLREQCDNPGGGGLYEPPACVDIGPGTSFRAQPWTGDIGDSQCACEECAPAGPGTYRFAVEACDHSARYQSATFDL